MDNLPQTRVTKLRNNGAEFRKVLQLVSSAHQKRTERVGRAWILGADVRLNVVQITLGDRRPGYADAHEANFFLITS